MGHRDGPHDLGGTTIGVSRLDALKVIVPVGLLARSIPGGAPQALADRTGLRGIDEDVDEGRTTMTEALVVGAEPRHGALSAVSLVIRGVPVNVVGEELDRRLQLAASGRGSLAERLHAQVGGVATRPFKELADLRDELGRLLRWEPDGSTHPWVVDEQGGATSVPAVPDVNAVNEPRAIADERGWPGLIVLAVVVAVITIASIVVPAAAITPVRKGRLVCVDEIRAIKDTRRARPCTTLAREDIAEMLLDRP